MKYLVINKGPRPGVKPADIPLAALQATRDFLKAKRADGTIDCMYAFATAGGVAIVNASTHEDLMPLLRNPTAGFSEFEVHPLCDFEKSFDSLIAMRQKLGQ